MNYEYDEEYDSYSCSYAEDLDEDDMYRFLAGERAVCHLYQPGNEYQIVKHQM